MDRISLFRRHIFNEVNDILAEQFEICYISEFFTQKLKYEKKNLETFYFHSLTFSCSLFLHAFVVSLKCLSCLSFIYFLLASIINNKLYTFKIHNAIILKILSVKTSPRSEIVLPTFFNNYTTFIANMGSRNIIQWTKPSIVGISFFRLLKNCDFIFSFKFNSK